MKAWGGIFLIQFLNSQNTTEKTPFTQSQKKTKMIAPTKKRNFRIFPILARIKHPTIIITTKPKNKLP